MITKDEIRLTLLRNEALVLFEWLANLESLNGSIFAHPTEEQVLWKIQGQLESTLVEPFSADYKELLAQARKSVKGDEV